MSQGRAGRGRDGQETHKLRFTDRSRSNKDDDRRRGTRTCHTEHRKMVRGGKRMGQGWISSASAGSDGHDGHRASAISNSVVWAVLENPLRPRECRVSTESGRTEMKEVTGKWRAGRRTGLLVQLEHGSKIPSVPLKILPDDLPRMLELAGG